jgi:hypothetical protein
MINTKLWVWGGGSLQERAGEVSAPSHVYGLGMLPPDWNAVVLSSRFPDDSCAAERLGVRKVSETAARANAPRRQEPKQREILRHFG